MADDDEPVDRPEKRPRQRSAADPKHNEQVEFDKKVADRELRDFVTNHLFKHPGGRRWIWDLLTNAGTFSENYGFAWHPQGQGIAYNPEATARLAGQKDFGLRLYHRLAFLDRAGTLSLHDDFDPNFKETTD